MFEVLDPITISFFPNALSDFGRSAEKLRAGQTLLISDARTDTDLTEAERASFAELGIVSLVGVPLVKEGRWIANLGVHQGTPRTWSADDLALLQETAERTWAAVERARAEEILREADRRKDEFLATLAHELRNPLAPLLNGLQVMKLDRNNAEAVERARAMMERQLGQMVRLIDDLLDLSRVSRGKIELKRERVELARVVQQAVETSRPAIDAGDHDLMIEESPEPIYVDADATRLAQVFSNLLNNAAKYTERGGRITLAVERQGGEAIISVTDTGVGIPAPMLPKVFEMFTQVDRSLEKSRGGLGIGLWLVQRLVQMHGGRVEVQSAGRGMGSRFLVRLPAASSPAPENPKEEAEKEAVAATGLRILVVDDSRDSAISLAMLLQIMGNETRTAHDGLEAMDAAAAFHPDVVLLDIGMPKLNGYDAARRIRQEAWGKNVVLVALTGWGQVEDKRRSREAGFNFHMVKPIDPAALEKLLDELRAGLG